MPDPATVDPPASVETTITDDDVPVATVSGPASVNEDAGTLGDGTPTGDDTATTVTLDPAPVRAVEVAWTITGTGSNPAEAADFGAGAGLRTGTVRFDAGDTEQVIPVTIANDTTAEPDEVTVRLDNSIDVDRLAQIVRALNGCAA